MKIPVITRYDPAPALPDEWPVCKNCGRIESLHVGGGGLARVCNVPTPEQTRQMFDEINRDGCARFDTLWLAINTDVVHLARVYGLDPSEPALRAVLVTLAYELCAKEQVTTEVAP